MRASLAHAHSDCRSRTLQWSLPELDATLEAKKASLAEATGDLERVSRIRTKVEQKNLGGSPGREARSAIGCRDGGIVGARASSGTTPGDLRRRAR